MKIALLTIWHEMNYGAELQAYSTIKVLQNLGHEVKMIDIRLADAGKPTIAGRLSKVIEAISPARRKFNKFWKEYIPTTRRYKSLQNLQNDPPVADIYMVGSDQVWNPDITRNFTNLYYLDFGRDEIKKVSYASSFGVSKWGYPERTEEIKKLLSNFAHVTCREQSGVDILKKEFGIIGEHVIDPTLLLGDFNSFVEEHKEQNTLVCYPLGEDTELLAKSEKIARKFGMSFVDNFNSRKILGRIVWDRNSIEQWVSNIANSNFVITRSFHGMLFSIMFQKQFAVVAGKNGRSVRLQNFLSSVGLENRYFKSIQELEEAEPWNANIDYSSVIPKVSKLRMNSLNTLKTIIQ